jgi:hypothetical protein
MPNGYRRGGRYRRRGRTYYRRGARIKPATKKSIFGVAVVTAGTMAALGSGVSVLVIAGTLGLGFLLIKNRRRIFRPLRGKAVGWATNHRARREPEVRLLSRDPELRRRIPSNREDDDDIYLDRQLRPHQGDGKFISLDEYRRRREAKGA